MTIAVVEAACDIPEFPGDGPQAFRCMDALEEDDEFIAAEAANEILLAERVLQPGRKALQQLITVLVTIRVVGGLEMIEVDDNERVADAAGVCEALLDCILYRELIVKSGEQVLFRE